MIGIVDYDIGNLRSVQKAFERVGSEHWAAPLREREPVGRLGETDRPIARVVKPHARPDGEHALSRIKTHDLGCVGRDEAGDAAAEGY